MAPNERVAAVRRFNRFYTRQIGLLQEGYLDSAFSLSQVRVLYELAHRDKLTASALSRDLGLDPGYLSRVLRDFEKRRFISRTRSEADGRQSHLELTARGQAVRFRAGPPRGRHARHREHPGRPSRAADALHPAPAPGGRHGLGRPSS